MHNTVIVTGGAGYIGSHVCKALDSAGYTPVTLDNLSRGFASAVKWGPLEVGDIRDASFLDRLFSQYNPIAVMHFAAFAYVGESVTSADLYWDNNVNGSRSLIDAMFRHGVDAMVFSSSCTVYGEPEEMPVRESTPLNPMSPYGETKLTIEKDLIAHAEHSRFNSVALRYFNAAGADPDGEIGEDHDPETHLIPLVLMAAQQQSGEIHVFGDDYPTRDGSCVRDYIHVSDLADAHVLALKYLESHQGAFQFNLGNQRGISVFEIIDQVKKLTGGNVNVRISQRRAGDVAELYSDTELAARELGWIPQRSSLDSIILTAWKWLRSK